MVSGGNSSVTINSSICRYARSVRVSSSRSSTAFAAAGISPRATALRIPDLAFPETAARPVRLPAAIGRDSPQFPLERLRAKWIPVRVKKTRQHKRLRPVLIPSEPKRLHRGYFTREEGGQLDSKAGFRFASAFSIHRKLKTSGRALPEVLEVR